MRRMVLLLATTVLGMALACGAALAAQGSAGAARYHPPDASVVKVTKERTERVQEGRPGSFCWPGPRPGGFRCKDKIGPIFVRRSPEVAAGRAIRTRVFISAKPDVLQIRAFRRVDENGFALGRGRPVETSLRRVVRDGRTVAWDAVFRLRDPGRDYYMDLFGVWGDGTEARRDASWAFHLETERRRR